MDKLKKIILIVIILIVIILVIALVLLKNTGINIINNDENVFSEEAFDENTTNIEKTKFSNVKYNDEYYSISEIIDSFCEQCENVNLGKNEYKKLLLEKLSLKYINDFKINENTLGNYIQELSENTYMINNMYSATCENNIIIYLVYGKLDEIKKDYNFIIALDLDSNAYEIYLNDYITKNNYIESNINNFNINNDKVKLNDNNEFIQIETNEEEMVQRYLDNYIYTIKNNTNNAYKILNKEYSTKRFTDYNNFLEYFNNRKDSLTSVFVKKYKVEYDNNTTKYICIDNYNNYYVFNAIAVMKYDVMLDDYTIPTEDFIEKYNNLEDKQKVLTNIEKFFKMINNKDYITAYGVLNDTFKANNFKTIDEFKKYIQLHFFENNVLTISEDFKKIGTYYSATVTYASVDTENKKTVKKTFIVELGQNTDFKMSFNK